MPTKMRSDAVIFTFKYVPLLTPNTISSNVIGLRHDLLIFLDVIGLLTSLEVLVKINLFCVSLSQ